VKLLHLDSSIQGENSASRLISAAVVERLQQAQPSIAVTYRDLVAEPVAHLDPAGFNTLDTAPEVQQFLDSDIVVIGAAFYNFTVASQLKAWIDHIVVAGRTFKYTENGPVGLVDGKRIIIALARGGIYSEGSPIAFLEHGESLLRGVFMGLCGQEPEFIIAEGLKLGEESRRSALDGALRRVENLTAQPALLAASA
jgi:FMN-dependent NADH-azoreductase